MKTIKEEYQEMQEALSFKGSPGGLMMKANVVLDKIKELADAAKETKCERDSEECAAIAKELEAMRVAMLKMTKRIKKLK